MNDKPEQCAPCPLSRRGKGFALGWGDPALPLSVCGEGLGADEALYRLDVANNPGDAAEFARRKAAFPNIDAKFLLRGRPFVGKTGKVAESWILRPLGLSWDSVFVDNALRCVPPKYGEQNYPTGDDRKKAEACCSSLYSQWDRTVKPQLAVVAIHPAALLREITPLPLVIRAVEKARDAAQQGIRTVLLLGGKAAKLFLGYAENSVKWCGHFCWLGKEGKHGD